MTVLLIVAGAALGWATSVVAAAIFRRAREGAAPSTRGSWNSVIQVGLLFASSMSLLYLMGTARSTRGRDFAILIVMLWVAPVSWSIVRGFRSLASTSSPATSVANPAEVRAALVGMVVASALLYFPLSRFAQALPVAWAAPVSLALGVLVPLLGLGAGTIAWRSLHTESKR